MALAIGDPTVPQTQTPAYYESLIRGSTIGTVPTGIYKGKTWVQLYEAIYAKNKSKYSAYQVYQAVAQAYLATSLGNAIDKSLGAAGTGIAATSGASPNAYNFNFLSGWAGWIAAGLEGGFVQILKDIWNVIVGPLEILTGFIVIALVLGLAFKDDILAVAGPLAMGAMI
jgi:hypothetical protein